MEHHVAFLDILGFREIIHNNDHKDLMHLFDNFRIYVQRAIADGKTIIDFRGQLVSDMSASTINSTIMSDSLVFWTVDCKASGFIELIERLHEFLRFCHNLPTIFLRGGITGGNFHYEHTGIMRSRGGAISAHPMMLGKALVDAYEIEKILQIAGCIITNEAIELAKANDDIGFDAEWKRLVDAKKVIKYSMPIKTLPLRWPRNWLAAIVRLLNGRATIEYWTINWVQDVLHPTYEELKKGFLSHKKNVTSKSAKQKVQNTMEYYAFVKKNIYN